jgi:integrase
VVLFERTPGGNLYREVWIGGKRVATKRSLGHRDRERAEADGYTLLAALKAREDALQARSLTLATLFDMYVGSPAHRAKKPRTRREDERKLESVVNYFGEGREVRSLTDSDVGRYRQARLRGECGPSRKAVRARTLAADLVALRTMLNWATRQRNNQGVPLLEYEPLRGVSTPVEKNPRRPVASLERYQATRTAMQRLGQSCGSDAERVRWVQVELALVLAEATGRRLSSIRQLRWEDIDLDTRTIQWRAEADKKGRDWTVPMPGALGQELREFRRRLRAVGGFVFARESDADEPMDRHLFNKWLAVAEHEAGLPKLKGGLWHPYRRKWATERKHHSLKDVAAAGGWKNTDTLLTCYQQPDRDTLLAVMSEDRKVREGSLP